MHGIIYKISNDQTPKIYIGQTICSLQHRWSEHKTAVTDLTCTDKLHTAMRKIGIEHFQIDLIEELINVTQKELDNREQYWINYYNSFENGYNSTKGGRYGTRNTSKVLCYTLSGKEYKSYTTIEEAAIDANISYNALLNCLNDFSQESCGGFQWKYEHSEKILQDFSDKKRLTGKKIYFIQYDSKGTYINHFLSVQEASKHTGCLESGIVRCAQGKISHCGGYKWQYGFLGEEIPSKIDINLIVNIKKGKSRRVIYINKNNQKIVFNSLAEASRITGYSRHKITHNCDIYPKTTLLNERFQYEEN